MLSRKNTQNDFQSIPKINANLRVDKTGQCRWPPGSWGHKTFHGLSGFLYHKKGTLTGKPILKRALIIKLDIKYSII